MKGPEHQVTGFRRLDRERDRIEIPELTDENHVRILAKRRVQAFLERLHVGSDLALNHE